MKKNTLITRIRKNPSITIVCVFAIISIILTISISFAAYTNSISAQRTVAAYDKIDSQFSSNYLTEAPSIRTLYVPNEDINPSCIISVSNYPSGKQNRPNAQQVTYNISVSFVKPNGEQVDSTYMDSHGYYEIEEESHPYTATFSNGTTTIELSPSKLFDSTTFSGTLTAGTASSDLYTLVLGDGFTTNHPDLYVRVVATPTSPTGLPILQTIFRGDIKTGEMANSWLGDFSDNKDINPYAYDGYNYAISGTGSGTISLTWDTTHVQMSLVSLNNLMSIEGASRDGNTITFPVNSNDMNRYDLQFYKVNIPAETTWENMGEYVECTFS